MRKTMLIVLLLALLLQPIVGQAQDYYTIGELRENLPERWTQTYETKWRTIDINVQPEVPDVERIPILQMMKDYWNPDISGLGDSWSIIADDSTGIFNVYTGDINENMIKATGTTYFDTPYDFTRKYGENSVMTLGETLACVKDVMEKLGETTDALQYDKPRDLHICIVHDKETGELLCPDIYIYYLKQQFHGIPVLDHVLVGIEDSRGQEPRIPAGGFLLEVSTAESCVMAGPKVKMIEVVTDDVPLCSFSLVQAALENEIKDGHIRKIFDLELGYVLYNTPDPAMPLSSKTLLLYAVPTWQVNCFYMASGKKEMSDHSNPNITPIAIAQMEYKTVFVNAQTGKVIDRMDNRKGCGNYQGFISWEDVGGKR